MSRFLTLPKNYTLRTKLESVVFRGALKTLKFMLLKQTNSSFYFSCYISVLLLLFFFFFFYLARLAAVCVDD